jgi:hypothetical protein
VNRHEDVAACSTTLRIDARDAGAPARADGAELAVAQAELRGVVGMNLDERFGAVLRQPR